MRQLGVLETRSMSMSTLIRTCLVVCLATAGTPATAQTPKAAAPAQTKAAPAATATKPAVPNTILAMVNGEPIKSAEVARFSTQYSIRPGDEKRFYDNAMEVLVNTKLLGQFLRKNRIEVKPAEVDEVVAQYEKAAKENNDGLVNQLAQTGLTMEEFRDQIARTLQWKKYVTGNATDSELKKYADANKDAFNGAQVRASHILISVKPDADAAAKQKAKDKLASLKKEIESGKLGFPDAANKFSEDPGNQQTPNGGDLGFFYRKDPFIEAFSSAAFALKKGQISDPVETEYGYHLIHVTDRKEGQPFDFQRDKNQILNQYAAELQQEIVDQERKKAEDAKAIKIEPLPKDLLKAAEPPPAPVQPGATKPAAPAAKPATKPVAKPAAKP